MRNIKKINIAPFNIHVGHSMTIDELSEEWADIFEDETSILGLYDDGAQEIWIAKDMSYKQKIRVLVHECVEAINIIHELGLDNHTKVVSLENAIINLILNNQNLIKALWEEFPRKGKGKSGSDSKDIQSTDDIPGD